MQELRTLDLIFLALIVVFGLLGYTLVIRKLKKEIENKYCGRRPKN